MKPSQYADILCIRLDLSATAEDWLNIPAGAIRTDAIPGCFVRWDGPKYLPVRFDAALERDAPELIKAMPWPLKRVHYDPFTGWATYVRTDVALRYRLAALWRWTLPNRLALVRLGLRSAFKNAFK